MYPTPSSRLRRSASTLVLVLSLAGVDACARIDERDESTNSVAQGDVPTSVGTNPNVAGNTTYVPLPDTVTGGAQQASLAYMASWPQIPGCTNCTSYKVRNWKDTSARYHALIFDVNAKGTYLPLVAYNAEQNTIDIPSYVGSAADANYSGEALTVLGGLLGASLGGTDMRSYNGRNWMVAAQGYSATPNTTAYVVNNPNNTAVLSAWYVLYPTILEAHLASIYRADPALGLTDLLVSSATTWSTALNVLVDNWDHSGYDFRPSSLGITEGSDKQPDMGIGIAYVSEMAYEASGRTREDLNQAAARCLTSMDARSTNPSYQVLGFYGPLVAARRNALRGESHSIGHYMNWVFASSSSVRNWAMLTGRWGSYDAYGLYGGVGNGNTTTGYAHSLYSLAAAAALAPVVRYAPSYAKAIGQYLLAVAVNAQQFFPDAVTSDRQDAYDVYQLLQAPIAYEGLSGKVGAESVATGGAARPTTNQAPYGAWAQGLMGALVSPTADGNVLQIDLLATDPWHPDAWPTYLYYNPNGSQVTVKVAVPGTGAVDFVDTVSGKTLARKVSGTGSLSLAAGQAVVLVMPTSGAALAQSGNVTTLGGVAIDWGLTP